MANLKDLIVSGSSRFIADVFADNIKANKFVTNGGTSSQFVKGDGTLDSNTYLTAADVTTYSAGNGIEISTGASPKTISAKLSSTTNGLGLGSAGLSLSLASTSAAGAMSSTDKTNLDTIYGNYLKAGNTIGTISLTEFNPVSDTVHVTSQSLGTSQQETARGNINAQETLVSGTNIKTINGQSLLGSGNIAISGGGGGGSITIDTELSASSTNPVENRVITSALNGKVSDVRVNGSSVVSSGIATIPANTDTMVTQTVTNTSGSSNWRGILIGASNVSSESGNLTTTTDTSLVFTNLRFQPSTGTLKATAFKGNLTGNVTGDVTGTASGNLTSASTLDPTKISGYSASGTTKFLRQDGTWQVPSGGGGTATTVQINGTSITSNNVANIITNTAYNASTNKIATMSDVPAAPGTLNTNNTTAQTASSSEALSGTIKLHKVAKTGTYSDLIGKPTIPTVNNSTITIQKGGTNVDSFTVNASSNKTINIPNELPSVSASDNGKILQVVNGAWTTVTPVTVYSGSGTPSPGTGTNGDIYIQTA